MRCIKAWIVILCLAATDRAWAESAKALGHHWYVPAYRMEMQTQILLMICVALGVLGGLLIARHFGKQRPQA